MHYTRYRLGITPFDEPQPLRNAPGEGSIIPDGYRVLNLPSHPLARAQGKVPEHRVVLYAKVGPGPHPCHWCGTTLEWNATAGTRINADHLDWDKLNNDPSNLVPACLNCNTRRRQVA